MNLRERTLQARPGRRNFKVIPDSTDPPHGNPTWVAARTRLPALARRRGRDTVFHSRTRTCTYASPTAVFLASIVTGHSPGDPPLSHPDSIVRTRCPSKIPYRSESCRIRFSQLGLFRSAIAADRFNHAKGLTALVESPPTRPRISYV